jgi:hypothetical protein
MVPEMWGAFDEFHELFDTSAKWTMGRCCVSPSITRAFV